MTERPLWRLIRFRPGFFALALVLWLLYRCYPLMTGILTRDILDALTGPAPAVGAVWPLIVLLASVEVGSWVLLLGWLFGHLTFEWSVEALLRTNVFRWILQQSGPRATFLSPGEVISRLRDDVEEVIAPINEWYRLVGEATFALVAVGVMVRINVLITLMTLLPLAAVVSFLHRMSARLQGYRAASRVATGQVTGFLGEIFGAAQAVKLAAAEGAVTARFSVLSETRRQTALRDTLLTQLIGAFTGNITLIATGVVLLLAVSALRAGRFTVGDFALFVIYLDWVLQLPRRVGRLLASSQLSGVSAQRMPGAPPGLLSAHSPIFLSGAVPAQLALPALPRAAADGLHSLDVKGLT